MYCSGENAGISSGNCCCSLLYHGAIDQFKKKKKDNSFPFVDEELGWFEAWHQCEYGAHAHHNYVCIGCHPNGRYRIS